jgi:hypothetical protein
MSPKNKDTNKTIANEPVEKIKNSTEKLKNQTEKTMKEKTENMQKRVEKVEAETHEQTKKVKESSKKAKHQAEERIDSLKEEFGDISELGRDPDFWEGMQENATESAKIIGEEAKEFAGKVAAYSEKIFGAIREKAEDVFGYGAGLTKDAVNYAQELSEKYRDRLEISKLNEEKKRTASQLGMFIYLAYKNNDNKVPRQTFAQKKVKSALKELEELDEKIIHLSDENE